MFHLVLAAALVLAAVHLVLVVAVAAARLAYPFELDWMEGAMLDQTLRLRAGLPLYVAPSLAYVPLTYAPLFSYAGAAMAALLGPGFAALRAVSALAAASTLLLLGVSAARATGVRAAGWIAAGLYAAGQHLAESWLDVGRSDSLYLMLLAAGAFAYRCRERGLSAPIAAGALWALAFLTKQSAPVALAPLFVWLVVRERGRGFVAVATFGVLAGIAVLAFDSASGGWFRYFVFGVPQKFPLDLSLASRFLAEMAPLLPAFAIGLGGAWVAARARAGSVGFHAAFACGLVLSSWLLRLYPGAGENVLLAAALAAAYAGGLGCGWLMHPPAPAWRRIAVPLALSAQLAILLRNPWSEIPRPEDRAAGADLVHRLAMAAGPVYVSYHPYLAERAGKPGHAHIAPLMDMVRVRRDSIQSRLWQDLRDSLRARAWSILVLDGRDWLREEAHAAGYREVARVFADDRVFWPVTGYRTRPEWVLVPEERVTPDSAAAPQPVR